MAAHAPGGSAAMLTRAYLAHTDPPAPSMRTQVGLTPLVFVVPPILYLMARGGEVSAAAYWAHVGLAVLFAAVGLLASIGAVRGIVLAIQQHDFYS